MAPRIPFHTLFVRPCSVSDAGNLRKRPLTLEDVDEDATISELKAMLAERLSGDVTAERMRLSWKRGSHGR